jgi:deazaflavin-dependent oxidoreductase (nitroreductase family)
MAPSMRTPAGTAKGSITPLCEVTRRIRDKVWLVPESQKAEQLWETPSLDEIPVISRGHVQALESATDSSVWSLAGMHHIVLTTVGRKSGNEHKVALPIWRDPQDVRVVVASFAGAPNHPAWYLNLADRAANPEVQVLAEAGPYWSVPDIPEGEDYERIWALLIEDRAWYRDYQAKTSRRIPLVRLPETRPA